MLKLSDLRKGDVLRAINDWADACWKTGDVLVVREAKRDGALYVKCGAGVDHFLIEENLTTLEKI